MNKIIDNQKTVFDISTWEEFEDLHMQIVREYKEANKLFTADEVVFRGLANAEFALTTTLERKFDSEISLESYQNQTLGPLKAIQKEYGRFSDIPMSVILKTEQDITRNRETLRWLEYFAYLRHYGYPSPLMDWSACKYVAAYFAFFDVQKNVAAVSINMFIERPKHVKGGMVGWPTINGIFLDCKEFKRHDSQKSRYSICTKGRDLVSFACHGSVFNKDLIQNRLFRFNIPVSERKKVLGILKQKNISTNSLFDPSEDALVKDLSTDLNY